jgi:2-polyprenyl-3-methyl-5-hydroxy-6-metoxy-1,4-benzoquinol methylase
MGCACHGRFGSAAEETFDRKVASRELRHYRRKGPRPTALRLRDSIGVHAPSASTLLDIGSGIGALTFALLEAGVRRATAVDASSAFLEAGREEATRRHVEDRVEWQHADFVAVAESLPAADIVTLDRVVCCYPDIARLLTQAAAHARRCIAFSYPSPRWDVRSVAFVQNAVRRLMGRVFEVFVHPVELMEKLVRRQGFDLASRSGGLVWHVDVYVRRRG